MLLDKHFLKMKIFGRLKYTSVSLNEFFVLMQPVEILFVYYYFCYMYCKLFNFSYLLLTLFFNIFHALFSECVFSILLTDIVRTIAYLFHYLFSVEVFKLFQAKNTLLVERWTFLYLHTL